MGFDHVDRKFRRPAPIKLECSKCQSTDGVAMEDSRTAYHFTGKKGSEDDPNRPIPLCRSCAEEHHANWDAQWADWRSRGIGV